MVRFFVLYVSVECYCSVSCRRLQVITVNSIISVENGRLGNLKKTQGNNFVCLKKPENVIFGGVVVRLVRKTSHSSRDSDTFVCIDQSGLSSLWLLAGKQSGEQEVQAGLPKSDHKNSIYHHVM